MLRNRIRARTPFYPRIYPKILLRFTRVFRRRKPLQIKDLEVGGTELESVTSTMFNVAL